MVLSLGSTSLWRGSATTAKVGTDMTVIRIRLLYLAGHGRTGHDALNKPDGSHRGGSGICRRSQRNILNSAGYRVGRSLVSHWSGCLQRAMASQLREVVNARLAVPPAIGSGLVRSSRNRSYDYSLDGREILVFWPWGFQTAFRQTKRHLGTYKFRVSANHRLT